MTLVAFDMSAALISPSTTALPSMSLVLFDVLAITQDVWFLKLGMDPNGWDLKVESWNQIAYLGRISNTALNSGIT